MKSSESPANTTENEVELMRRALGLSDQGSHAESPPDPRGGGGQMQRHDQDRRARRFVRDGEVPVVVLNRARDVGGTQTVPTNRLALAENALRGERAARERAERALHEAQANIQHLQTQIGHATLAHAEALSVEREARELAERRLSEMTAARDAAESRLAEARLAEVVQARLIENLEARRKETVSARVTETVTVAPAGVSPARGKVARKPRGTSVPPKKTAENEQEAVKWWLPTFKARSRSA